MIDMMDFHHQTYPVPDKNGDPIVSTYTPSIWGIRHLCLVHGDYDGGPPPVPPTDGGTPNSGVVSAPRKPVNENYRRLELVA